MTIMRLLETSDGRFVLVNPAQIAWVQAGHRTSVGQAILHMSNGDKIQLKVKFEDFR